VENRRAARKRVLKTGYIVISDKAPKIECTIRNVSETGASIQVSTTIGIRVVLTSSSTVHGATVVRFGELTPKWELRVSRPTHG
jgi:hypothetical protein